MSKGTFDFSEALRRMKEGKKIKRRGWETTSGICIMDGNLSIIGKVFTYNDIPSYCSFFSLDDILATDWEEVE